MMSPLRSQVVRGSAALLATAVAVALCAMPAKAEDKLVQVFQNFDADPGWEGYNNRIIATEGNPTIKQDFGWRPTDSDGDGKPGEIGGVVWRSRTPAWYGFKLKPLSLDDALSASGTLVLKPGTGSSDAYFGFFNSSRQGWRPWNSMAVRVGPQRGVLPPMRECHFDYMTATWKAGGYSTVLLPADGKPHRWRIEYDPNATVPTSWPDPRLKDYIINGPPENGGRTPTDMVFARAKQAEPDAKPEDIQKRLETAAFVGLIGYHTRRGTGWEVRREAERVKGKMIFQLDDGPVLVNFIDSQHRAQPMEIDRFGIFNMQLPGDPTEMYLSNLKVNGRAIDLSSDPAWEGRGNDVTFVERDFHAKNNFGFSQSHFAGRHIGEIGGTFWRVETVDPLHGYYADDVGRLTLDDPIRFSGEIAFLDGATDAGMFFGYFNLKERMALFGPELGGEAGAPVAQSMGITIDGPTRIGYNFSGQVTPANRANVGNIEGPVFVPDGTRKHFTFDYDPAANNGQGTITISLGDTVMRHNLTPEQRKQGGFYDRFGLVTVRRGGKFVTVYLDDLSYTARRAEGATPVKHEQKVVTVPYPKGGRKY